MNSKIKKILLILFCLIIVIISALVILFFNEIRSLCSLKKIDDYGMYQMTYYGDYGFDEFLKTGAKSDKDIEKFVTKRLLKGLPININVEKGGCTAFVTRNEKDEIIYGRNFDFKYAPSVQVYTKPDNGYASVSTVNLAFAGYSENNLPKEGISFSNFLTLATPYLPFDGLNEKGVAIALLAVPEADGGNDSSKVTLNTTTAIRLVLDKADSVDKAISLMNEYNIYFSGDVECHYLIADSTGNSVIVEFYDGAMQVVKSDNDYQIASNFIAYNGLNIGEGFSEFERYDKVKEEIENNQHRLSEMQAVKLLADIGVNYENIDKLQWTVVYNLTTGNGKIFAHRKTDKITEFHIDI